MVLELFTKNLHDFKLLNVDVLYPWIMYNKWGLIKHFFEHINKIHDTEKLPSALYIRNFCSCGSLFKLFCCGSVGEYYLCFPVCVFGLCYIYTRYLDWWGFLLLGSLQNLATWQANQLDGFNVYEVLLEYGTLVIGVISSVRCISILLLFDGWTHKLCGFFYLGDMKYRIGHAPNSAVPISPTTKPA